MQKCQLTLQYPPRKFRYVRFCENSRQTRVLLVNREDWQCVSQRQMLAHPIQCKGKTLSESNREKRNIPRSRKMNRNCDGFEFDCRSQQHILRALNAIEMAEWIWMQTKKINSEGVENFRRKMTGQLLRSWAWHSIVLCFYVCTIGINVHDIYSPRSEFAKFNDASQINGAFENSKLSMKFAVVWVGCDDIWWFAYFSCVT